MRTFATLAAALVGTVLLASPASAQASRTFVSGGGNDANSASDCGRSAPCRSFGTAIGVTNAGGEIVVLSSAGYGPFTIGKAITITAIGVEAAITSTSGDGITINAGASDVVTLRGLTLIGLNQVGVNGINGITLTSAATLNIQNCVIRDFHQAGLNLVPNAPSTVNVSDTTVSNNGADGINFRATAGLFERVQAIGNGLDGITVGTNSGSGKMNAIAINSIATRNHDAGFSVFTTSSTSPVFTVIKSESFSNSQGVLAGGNVVAQLIVSDSKIYENGVGIF